MSTSAFATSSSSISDQAFLDSSWTRVLQDFLPDRPLPPSGGDGSVEAEGGGGGDQESEEYEWTYQETTELVTLDFGTNHLAEAALFSSAFSLGGLSTSSSPSSSNPAIHREAEVGVADQDPRARRYHSGSARSKKRDYTNQLSSKASSQASRSTSDPSTTVEPSSSSSSSSSTKASGKPFSITGLETPSPLVKLGNTFFRGVWDELVGTEIVLVEDRDPTRPLGKRHTVRPIPPDPPGYERGGRPTTGGEDPNLLLRPDARSSTLKRRIHLVPIYDPRDSERLPPDPGSNWLADPSLDQDQPDQPTSPSSFTQA
ncbi:hypothetical protein IE53DRAFT_387834 [Violaceomyces palustris]|uniref:Uncharacterized protein n=1 Tax=Violaceomyces palustris TaxID=1673888 RepID=A0ACD0NW08_9BASI|nr:hypothetical protein IE53DRAFT_387834 [Violaceomyces palustris]